jgi:hypothetical protein
LREHAPADQGVEVRKRVASLTRVAGEQGSAPWREEAVVIRTTSGGRQLVFSGELWLAVEWFLSDGQSSELSIALPDRHVPPFAYTESQVRALALAADRPCTTPEHRHVGLDSRT